MINNIKGKMDKYGVPAVSLSTCTHGKVSSLTIGALDYQLFHACSISKMMTALLVVKLEQFGELDLDVHVVRGCTLRQLLVHQTGLQDIPGHDSSKPFSSQSLQYTESRRFAYADSNYCFIQQYLEKRFGIPYRQLVESYIFDEYEMSNSRFPIRQDLDLVHGTLVNEDQRQMPLPDPSFHAAEGLWTTAADLGQMTAQLMGRDEELFIQMCTPLPSAPWAGLGIFFEGDVVNSLGWGEGFQGMVVLDRKTKVSAIVLTNHNSGRHQREGFIGDVVDYLLKRREDLH
ncbi:serine hydrolase [Geomicrobium sp. JCM 19039]|uniref:serine hydrolase domain-containing protein n=1 Tax=Geomicrobium sp. JCM 19039 TaxID=1460636 RepID=UPI00045F3DE3|nr:serine hydrolase domain-containing protein [Geomicrobium sp. JCM 19039]GAK13163.1 beta-lactamase [Geomicrobium sp. JCM 19039]